MIRSPNRKPPREDAPEVPEEDRRAERIRAARAGELIWMNATEAAEYLGESLSRFRAAAARGEFDRYKDIGGDRYHRDELDDYRRLRAGRP